MNEEDYSYPMRYIHAKVVVSYLDKFFNGI